MKFIFVSNIFPSVKYPFKGTFVNNVFCGFRDLGCNVELISIDENISNKIVAYFVFYWKMFISGLNSESGDVFYIHYVSHSSLGLVLLHFFKPNLVIVSNVHGSDVVPIDQSFFSRIKKILSRKVLSISKLVVVPSNYFKSIIVNDYDVDGNNIFVSASGGVDSSIFTSTSTNEKKFTFGYVGRLEEDKGIFDLVDSFKKVLLVNPLVNLIIVGSGSQEMRLRDLVSNISNVTIISGQCQKELVSIYLSIRFLVFPSKRKSESLGLIPIEAMMCGVPVIASKNGAYDDYIKSSMQGFSFTPGDTSELESVMLKSLTVNNSNYKELSILAINTAKFYCSDKVIFDLHEHLKCNLTLTNGAL